MSIEILARMTYFLKSQDPIILLKLLETLPPIIKNALLVDKKKIFELLQDMRPLLNLVNQSNKNIASFKTRISIISKSSAKTYSDGESSWLDICKDVLCFGIPSKSLYIRMGYDKISENHMFLERTLKSFQVTLK